MSCDNPGTGKADLMPRRPKYDKDPVCVRCRNKEIPASIIVRHSVYCRSCFLTSLGHRFRKSLEPTINPPEVTPPPGPRRIPLRPVLKASGNLLLGFSGGPASSLLLDLIHESYFTPAQLDPARGTKQKSKRENVWPIARVAFIDMSAAYPGTPDRTEDARRLVARYPHFEFVPLRIEHAFDPSWAASVGFSLQGASLGVDLHSEDLPAAFSVSDTAPAVALATYISSQPSSSARATALRTLTRLLLQHTARHTKSSHLLLGTSLTSYAIDLLDAVAIGAGFAIRQVGEETWEDIRIVRPLREITDKEVAAGVWWRRIEVMPASIGGGVLTSKESGITKLTKEFITGLDRDFPSTVHTIARTCEKLEPKGGMAARCPLCERPVQPGVQTWKAQIAIREFDAESKSIRAEGLLEGDTGLVNADPRANSNVPPTLRSSPAPNPDASRAPEPSSSGCTDGVPDDSPPNPAPSLDSARPPPKALETSPDALAPSLCYACHTQLTSRGRVPGKATGPADRGESVTLPVWVRPNLERTSGVGLPQDVRKYLLDEC